MTFWDFANAHPYITIVLVFLATITIDSMFANACRASAASSLLKRAQTKRDAKDDA